MFWVNITCTSKTDCLNKELKKRLYKIDKYSKRKYMVLMLWRRSASFMSTTRGSSTIPKSITRTLFAWKKSKKGVINQLSSLVMCLMILEAIWLARVCKIVSTKYTITAHTHTRMHTRPTHIHKYARAHEHTHTYFLLNSFFSSLPSE